MNRLVLVKNNLSSKTIPYVDSAVDYFRFSDLLTPEEEALRKEVRAFAETSVAPFINDCIETAKFPDHLIPAFRKSDIFSHFISKPLGKGTSLLGTGLIVSELARIDGSVSTFTIVQGALAIHTIDKLASEAQKLKYLPLMRRLELISGWGLTEENYGSDASSLETVVTKNSNGDYVLNGNKRWIGNGDKDLLVVWARNTENKKIEAFILNMKTPGVTTQAIKHKLPLRMVQNCQIYFRNVVVPAENKLPKAIDFIKGTTIILKHSRVLICWVAVGTAIGVYDKAIEYISNRKQFSVPISSFQLIQEKISRIMGTIQAMILLSWRISRLAEAGTATLGQISMAKAWVTLRGREVCALGREMFGGNGITFDNFVMKAMCDMEALYTYEGTYDINSLIGARELTGISAFKASSK